MNDKNDFVILSTVANECQICYRKTTTPALKCMHRLCFTCLNQLINRNILKCPSCRRCINHNDIQQIADYDDTNDSDSDSNNSSIISEYEDNFSSSSSSSSSSFLSSLSSSSFSSSSVSSTVSSVVSKTSLYKNDEFYDDLSSLNSASNHGSHTDFVHTESISYDNVINDSDNIKIENLFLNNIPDYLYWN